MRKHSSAITFPLLLVPCFAILLFPAEASTAIPPPLRAAIESAITGGDATEIAAVVKHAKRASPESAAAIERLVDQRMQVDAGSAVAAESFQGQGEFGGSFATGEHEYTGLTAGLTLKMSDDDWHHAVIARLDYQQSLGATTRDRHLLSYQPYYELGDRAYVYGLGQHERDRALGYASRYTLSTGLGYRFGVAAGVELNLEAGPAYRLTEFIGGRAGRAAAGRGSFELDSRIGPALSFNQAIAVYADSLNSTLSATSALSAKLFGQLSARLTYNVQFESDPPEGTRSVDTLGRASLVYEF